MGYSLGYFLNSLLLFFKKKKKDCVDLENMNPKNVFTFKWFSFISTQLVELLWNLKEPLVNILKALTFFFVIWDVGKILTSDNTSQSWAMWMVIGKQFFEITFVKRCKGLEFITDLLHPHAGISELYFIHVKRYVFYSPVAFGTP